MDEVAKKKAARKVGPHFSAGVTDAELRTIDEAANKEHLPRNVWVRRIVLMAAETATKKTA